MLVVAIGCFAGVSASEAIAAGALTVAPEQVDFGAQPFGSSSERTLVATNAGPDAVLLSDVVLIGDVDPFDYVVSSCEPGVVLAAEGTCDVGLIFSPVGFQATSHEVFLAVEGQEGDEPGMARLTAATQASTPLSATPAALIFDGGPLGGPSQQVQIRNDSATALPIGAPEVTGPFRGSGLGCQSRFGPGLVLDPGASCSFSVRITGPLRSSSERTGALTVKTGDFSLVVPLSAPAAAPPAPRGPVGPRMPSWPVEIRLGDLTDAVPALIRGGPKRARLLPAFGAGEAGRLSVTVFGWKRAHRLRIGGGALDFAAVKSGRLKLRLDKKGRALLRRPQRTRIKVVAKFEARAGDTSRQAPEYMVKRPKAAKPKAKTKAKKPKAGDRKAKESKAKKKRRPQGRRKL
jgi:hypothetical protein